MDILKEYKKRIDEMLHYRHVAEDVDIIKETNIDENLSLYIVRNKNGVNFQNVPGMAFIGSGKLAYVRGDRSRQIMIGTSDINKKIRSGKYSAGDLGPGVNRVTSNVTVIIDYEWDIQLEATRGAEVVTETKTSYIKVI